MKCIILLAVGSALSLSAFAQANPQTKTVVETVGPTFMRYRHCVGAAMTLAVMGYHFQVMTRRLSGKSRSPVTPPAMQKCLPFE